MNDFLTHSAYISVFISLIAFYLGSKLFLKFHFPLFNPLLTAVLLVIGFLKVTGMDYKDYNEGASYINYLLTPSTICLAVPLYEQIKLLKKNYKAIFLGILSGVVTGLFAVYVLCLAFGFDHASYVTLLPKSITTAIGMGLSEELGGHGAWTHRGCYVLSLHRSRRCFHRRLRLLLCRADLGDVTRDWWLVARD